LAANRTSKRHSTLVMRRTPINRRGTGEAHATLQVRPARPTLVEVHRRKAEILGFAPAPLRYKTRGMI
jgi:hypothetical protein